MTESMRDQVYAEYKRMPGLGCFVVDHLVPLELGGSNDLKNLWRSRMIRVRAMPKRTSLRTSCTSEFAGRRCHWLTHRSASSRTGRMLAEIHGAGVRARRGGDVSTWMVSECSRLSPFKEISSQNRVSCATYVIRKPHEREQYGLL